MYAVEKEIGYFKEVKALSDYKLEVVMSTGTIILFDFGSRLNTARFKRLKNKEMFSSATTDGHKLIFVLPGLMPVQLTAKEFMDLVLVDRTGKV